MPLPAARGWTQELEAGLEWRWSETTRSFAGEEFHKNIVVAAPLSAGWRGWRADKLGAWSLSADATLGVDWPLGHVTREAYQAKREGATPGWIALQASAARDWALPGDFRAKQRVWGQWSPDRLADAGKFNLGGSRSVRGYRESEVSGDGGLGWTAELLSPSLLRWPKPSITNEAEAEAARAAEEDVWRLWRPFGLRLAAFYDGGWVYQSAPCPEHERASTGLSGAGFGLRLEYGPWVSVRADYAWRLRYTDAAGDDRRGYGYLSANVSF